MSNFTAIISSPVVMGDQREVEKHLEDGKRLLQEGQLSEAVYHYSAAVGELLSSCQALGSWLDV